MRLRMYLIKFIWESGGFSTCIGGCLGFGLLQVWQIADRTAAHHLFVEIPERSSTMLDRISDLPDSLLLLLMSLSLVTARDAVQTSLFNKRWKNLWVSLPYLHFDLREFTSKERFCDFVDTMLSRRETHLDTFELWCKQLRQRHYESIERWIRYAVQHSTRVLRINAPTSSVFPDCIFNCESLEELNLGSRKFKLYGSIDPAPMVNLPRLRMLRLQGLGFWLVDGFLQKLLLGCPVLEDLSLSLDSLDLLTVFGLFNGGLFFEEIAGSLKYLPLVKFPGVFITSNSDQDVLHLFYSRSGEGLTRLTRLYLPSLIEANILVHVDRPVEIGCYLNSILSGLSNVERLQLCMHIKNLELDKMDQLVLSSTLSSLKRFAIRGLFSSGGFYYLSGLWRYMPNLEELTLWQSCQGCPFDKDGVDGQEDNSCIVSTEKLEVWGNGLLKCKKLRKVDIIISNFNGKVKQKVFALLKCWTNLINVEICVTTNSS